MKARTLAVVLALLVSAGAAYITLAGGTSETVADDAGAPSSPPSLDAYKEAATDLARARSRAASARLTGMQVRTVSSSTLFSGDTRLIALSPDELEWMQRHHYPTQKELEAPYSGNLGAPLGMPDPKLETLRGLALLKNGREIGGIAVLTEAGAQGAIYAYQQAALAEYAMNVRELGKSRETDTGLRARLEVAKMLGDYRTDELIRAYLPDYDDRANAHALQLQTTEYMKRIGESTQLRGLPPVGPDPRPNQYAWADLQKLNATGESVDVEIYTSDQ